MISSLQTRLLLAVGVMAIAAVAAVAITARQSTRFEFERFQTIQRVRESDDIEPVLDRVSAALDRHCCAADARDRVTPLLTGGKAALVFDRAGTLTTAFGAGTDRDHFRATYTDGLVNIDSREGAPGTSSGMFVTITGGPVRSIHLTDGGEATVLVVPMVRPDRDQPAAQFLGSIDRRLLVVTAAIAGFALLLTFAIARRIVRPIEELRDATRDLAAGHLSRRVTASGRDEVAELARGFNQMAAALERQDELRRNLVHDVAHELRTPLTALRCRVETVLDGMVSDPKPLLAQINEEVAHLSQLVSDLEELAHAEARDLTFAMADTRVADVCRSAIRVAGLEEDRRLRVVLDETLHANVDAIRVRQIVLNLLTNADRHTTVEHLITVRTRADGDAVILEVHNTGSALTPEQLTRVFDRFYRTDEARQRSTGGSGLGLAIVKHLAEAQGGRVFASSDDTGVTFGVRFKS